MKTSNAILLVESEEQVIKDVVCSLRLIDVPVLSSASVAEAKQSALKEKPALILARLRLQDDESAGITLARDLADEKMLGDVPVVVLCTPSEKRLLEGVDVFDAQISLPVEFPLFTRQVQSLMDSARKKTKASAVSLVPKAAKAAPAREEENQPPVHNNLAIVSGIQFAVLEKLKNSGALQEKLPEEIPALVAEVTHEVCSKFDPKKPI